jgi:hypothetical protein
MMASIGEKIESTSASEVKIVHTQQCKALNDELSGLLGLLGALAGTKKTELMYRSEVQDKGREQLRNNWTVIINSISQIETIVIPTSKSHIERLMADKEVCEYCRNRASKTILE